MSNRKKLRNDAGYVALWESVKNEMFEDLGGHAERHRSFSEMLNVCRRWFERGYEEGRKSRE